jgi:hypothetical protein
MIQIRYEEWRAELQLCKSFVEPQLRITSHQTTPTSIVKIPRARFRHFLVYGFFLNNGWKGFGLASDERKELDRLRAVFKIEALIWVSLWRVGSNLRRQSKNIKMKHETQNLYQTCACIIWYMFSVLCGKIKNQPSNSTSCSDNALRLLGLVAGILHWGFQTTSSISIWDCVLKGCFWERYILKGKIAFEGHSRLQSWYGCHKCIWTFIVYG